MDTDLQILFVCSLVVGTEILFLLAQAVAGSVLSTDGTYLTFVGMVTLSQKLIFHITLTAGDVYGF